MKRFFTIVAVSVLAMAVSAVMAQESKAEQEVHALNRSNTQALLQGDIATLDRNMADEFMGILRNGAVVSKAEVLNNFKNGRSTYDSIEELDSKVRIYGETAVLITTEKSTGKMAGVPFSGQYRNTFVYVKRDGRWVSVLRHMTTIMQPQPQLTEGK
jgi:hypothetical protein